jgi:hypothetical protein
LQLHDMGRKVPRRGSDTMPTYDTAISAPSMLESVSGEAGYSSSSNGVQQRHTGFGGRPAEHNQISETKGLQRRSNRGELNKRNRPKGRAFDSHLGLTTTLPR